MEQGDLVSLLIRARRGWLVLLHQLICTTSGLMSPATKSTKYLIRSRLFREGLGTRIDREQFDLIGPDGIEIDPKVWPADLIGGAELRVLFWEQDDAAEEDQAQHRLEQAQDQREDEQNRREQAQDQRDEAQNRREQVLDRREEAQTRREQAQALRDQAQIQRDQAQIERDREQNERDRDRRNREQNQMQEARDQRPLNAALMNEAHECKCRTCDWTQRECLAFLACRRRLGDCGRH